MISCLVCVGTSSFDRLIIEIDKINRDDIEFFIQYGNSTYKPKHHKCTDWVRDFDLLINDFDIIITHAGAGSVYSMLENKLRIIVVPNLDRVDKHQTEITHFVQQNDFADVCYAVENIENQIVALLENSSPKNTYIRDNFFKADDILKVVYR
jgi:beta-1,4-N-acetylglucosaminyltransferase